MKSKIMEGEYHDMMQEAVNKTIDASLENCIFEGFKRNSWALNVLLNSAMSVIIGSAKSDRIDETIELYIEQIRDCQKLYHEKRNLDETQAND